jgi:hypothetical protein
MTDTFTAYASTWTTVNGLQEQTWTSQGSTPGRISGRGRGRHDTNTRVVTIGGEDRVVMDGGLHIPLDAPVPSIGWEYLCTDVGGSSDQSLLGRRWRVVDVPAKSAATARRLDVVEVPA